MNPGDQVEIVNPRSSLRGALGYVRGWPGTSVCVRIVMNPDGTHPVGRRTYYFAPSDLKLIEVTKP